MITVNSWFDDLGNGGYTNGTLNDRLFAFLGDQGYAGTIDDRLNAWLGSKGYTGVLGERLAKALRDGVVPAPVAELQALYDDGSNGVLVPSITDLRSRDKLWQDVAKTTLAISVGDPVAVAEDLSGNGNDLTQSTSTARPTLQQDANGWWYLYRDGVDDRLDFPSSLDMGTQPVTMISVHRLISGVSSFGEIVSLGDDAVFGGRFGFHGSNDAYINSALGGNERYGPFNVDFAVFRNEFPGGGADIGENRFFVDGSERSRLGWSSQVMDVEPGGSIGSVSGDGNTTEADHYGLLVIFRALTQQEIDNAEAYMSSKAGISL